MKELAYSDIECDSCKRKQAIHSSSRWIPIEMLPDLGEDREYKDYIKNEGGLSQSEPIGIFCTNSECPRYNVIEILEQLE